MVPIPVPVSAQSVIIYAMVLYDADRIVREVDWATFVEPGGAWLEVGDYVFTVDRDSDAESLFLTLDASREALRRAAPADACRMTIRRASGEAVRVNDKLIVDSRREGHSVFVQIDLKPGQHRLTMEFPFIGYFPPREFSTEFGCREGQNIYAHLETKLVPTGETGVFVNKFRTEGAIEIEEELPAGFFDYRKILYQSGKWLIQP
jgi:hypothetical protein